MSDDWSNIGDIKEVATILSDLSKKAAEGEAEDMLNPIWLFKRGYNPSTDIEKDHCNRLERMLHEMHGTIVAMQHPRLRLAGTKRIVTEALKAKNRRGKADA